MSSGDSPDGTGAAFRTDGDVLFTMLPSTVPVGGSPTGAGESPALPFFETRSWVIGLLRLEQDLLELFFAGAGVGDSYPQDVTLRGSRQ